jgi:hypothetical protein
MINWKDVEGSGRGLIFRYNPICLQGLRETKKNISENSRYPGRDLNLGPPEYEAGVFCRKSRK